MNIADKKNITCVECPSGCRIRAWKKDDGNVSADGNKCEKGYEYACKEMTCPERYLTTTISGYGLEVKMVPVRTTRPIPKSGISDVMEIIKKTTIRHPVRPGDVIIPDILGFGADIIATRKIDLDLGPGTNSNPDLSPKKLSR